MQRIPSKIAWILVRKGGWFVAGSSGHSNLVSNPSRAQRFLTREGADAVSGSDETPMKLTDILEAGE